MLEPALDDLRPNSFHAQSLLFKDWIERFGALGCLRRADSRVDVIHLEKLLVLTSLGWTQSTYMWDYCIDHTAITLPDVQEPF